MSDDTAIQWNQLGQGPSGPAGVLASVAIDKLAALRFVTAATLRGGRDTVDQPSATGTACAVACG